MDEPTSALDPEVVGDVLKVMKNLAKEDYDHGGCDTSNGICQRCK